MEPLTQWLKTARNASMLVATPTPRSRSTGKSSWPQLPRGWPAAEQIITSPGSSTNGCKEGTVKLPAFVRSRLATDPNLRELVNLLVQENPGQINALDVQAKRRG